MSTSTRTTNACRRLRRSRRALALLTTAIVSVGGIAMTGVAPAHAAFYCGVSEFSPHFKIFVGNDGFWDVATNWLNGVPVGGDTVCVPGGVVARVRAASTYLLPAHDGDTEELLIEGTIRIESGTAVDSASAVYGAHHLINGGVIQLLNGSTFNMIPDQGGTEAFQNVPGAGSIQVGPGSKVVLRRPFLNKGSIDLTGGGQLVLDSSASAYNTGGSNGSIVGGQLRMTAGLVDFDGGGALSVLSSGGAAKGTIAANQTLEIACTAFQDINLAQNIVNNGTIRFSPPLAGNHCTVQYTLPPGSTLQNNGTLIFGSSGVKAFDDTSTPAYTTNFYQRGGIITNSPTGTIDIYDYLNSLEPINNQGTLVIHPGGFFQHYNDPLPNSGTIVNHARCDLHSLENAGGTFELSADCGIRHKATFDSASTLRPHWVNGTLAKLTVGENSPIAGAVNVVVDGTPPAAGTTADLIKGAVTGTFASVTSAAQSFSAKYLQDNSAVQLVAGAGGGGSAISPVDPARLLDTRTNGTTVDGLGQAAGAQAAGSTVEVPVLGRAGVPNDATAVALNVTVTEAQGAGYVTVWPCGTDRPNASSLNFVQGSTVPNGVISKIGAQGRVCIYVSNGTQVIADVGGYFTASSPYSAILPARLFDSRAGQQTIDGIGQGGGPVALSSITEVQVTGRAGVPGGAAAAVLNVTVTEAAAAGYVTVFPCGTTPPTASNLNFVQGSTVPNNVISKIGDGGKVCLFASNPTHLIVDVNGYFGASPAFQAISPLRVLDSRPTGVTTDGVGQAGGAAVGGTSTEVQITGRAGVPAGAVAAVLNVTVTEAQGPGYVTVFPCGTTPPTASNLNFVTGSTVPNGVIAKLGSAGRVCLFASNGTHLIADVSGYFTG